eukprot:2779747-Amphidinium_carterae.1
MAAQEQGKPCNKQTSRRARHCMRLSAGMSEQCMKARYARNEEANCEVAHEEIYEVDCLQQRCLYPQLMEVLTLCGAQRIIPGPNCSCSHRATCIHIHYLLHSPACGVELDCNLIGTKLCRL